MRWAYVSGVLGLLTAWSATIRADPMRPSGALRVRPSDLPRSDITPWSHPQNGAQAAIALDRLETAGRALTPTWHPGGGSAGVSVLPFSPSYSIGLSVRISTP